jgi:hypothetical protein
MVKAEAAPTGKIPSSLTKSKTLAKCTMKDVTEVFAEGSIRDARTLEHLGTQKHERALGELELRRRRINQKTLDRRHQRERKREQHEIRMMQMRLALSQNQQGTSMAMEPPAQTQSYGCLGLMDELNDGSLPNTSSYSV